MADHEFTDKQSLIADFRYGIIADLLNPHLDEHEVSRLVKEKASRTYEIPWSTKTSITPACIKIWLSDYRARGKDGLVPKQRNDAGLCKKLTDTEKELLVKILEKKPYLHASDAVRMLVRQGDLLRAPSKSSLSRFIRSQNLERSVRMASQSAPDSAVLKFAFRYPLECVQVDAMHSFSVPDHKGIRRKAILIACIDDATRRVVYAHFSFSENSIEFEKAVKHILLAHGKIIRLYTDNGSTFISLQTKRILDSLGIILIHSKPGVPKGRGKIERFFRTVRAQFERTIDQESVKSISDYDTRFRVWLESEYHRTPHSGIENHTPLDAWIAGAQCITHPDPTVDLHDAFCHEEFRKVNNDATVSVQGLRFEVPSHLIGKKIKLRFDPLSPLLIMQVYLDGILQGTAKKLDEYANAHSKRALPDTTPSQQALRSSMQKGVAK